MKQIEDLIIEEAPADSSTYLEKKHSPKKEKINDEETGSIESLRR